MENRGWGIVPPPLHLTYPPRGVQPPLPPPVTFELLGEDAGTRARLGRLTTDHGAIETPAFMPVGTVGSVKAVQQRELAGDLDASVILGNTYHLYLRPGPEVLEAAGGLHRFMGWDRPILTDSGGFQVFSLAHRRTLSEEGAEFQSHLDGSKPPLHARARGGHRSAPSGATS
jgi:queuine tRNA-ribosyltransferase